MIRQSMSISIYMKIDGFIALKNFTGPFILRFLWVGKASVFDRNHKEQQTQRHHPHTYIQKCSLILIHLGTVQNVCAQRFDSCYRLFITDSRDEKKNNTQATVKNKVK